MDNDLRPLLAVTLGDVAGTGPELVTKAMTEPQIYSICRPLVVGDAGVLRDAVKITGLPLVVHAVSNVAAANWGVGVINILDLKNMDPALLRRGEICAASGLAAYQAIERAVELTLEGATRAIVTSAINKAALHRAGFHYDGHTELLAHLCGGPPVTMMLVADQLRICHVSTHVSLSNAVSRVTVKRILEVVRLAHDGVQKQGISNPRIAVAGLNPHAGEGGLFGREEISIISPAIEAARALGYQVSGPYAGDTVFYRTLQGEFDCAIAMYHDQGHVAAKMLGIWQGVNVTLGLPIIRTSVEHGTDFANAGKGTGDPRSLVQAIKLAAVMATNRTTNQPINA